MTDFPAVVTDARVRRILIVDDSPDDRAEVRRLLLSGSDLRYQFAEAETGTAALRVLDGVDCMVLDYYLPDMDAPEVLGAMRSGQGTTCCPVVVLTGAEAREMASGVLRAGAVDYLGKGWMNSESMTRAVENAVERFALQCELLERDEALRQANEELENRVRERTAELAAALDSLTAEMGRRRDLARRLDTAQEDERRRVARDLHDTVGQLMAGLSLSLKAIETGSDLPAPIAAKLVEAQRVTSDLGRELHSLAVRLRPTSLDDIGLEAAVGQLVTEWSARTGVRADYHAAGLGPGRLPAEAETTVYRVVQEALTNVAKHARATAVGVVVSRTAGAVAVVVEDDGAGFDPGATPTGRLGLLGMQERVELVGGEIDIDSAPGAGTTVAVQISVPNGGGS